MHLLLGSIFLLVFSGLMSWALGPSKISDRVGVWGGIAACAAGLVPAVRALLGAPVAEFRAAWDVPGGSFYVGLDPLSALFLVPILALSALGLLYGSEYMARGRRPRGHWLFYNLLTASMALVVLARNGVLFLVAWEAMAVASFFLVTTDDDRESVRDAGWTYLVATHLGTAFLLGLFALLGRHAGSLDFDRFEALAGLPAGAAAAAFLFAVIGFGAKAGFVPFHVWLPEAHPAAPSHVSAVMSGVMIKTGIYGLVRALTFLGPPPAWWGWTLVAMGLVCGVGGVLFALAQHDLKRLLAYHSVENIGIITLGLGTGLLGLAKDMPVVAALGFAGALLHVINHAVFKGLLFLGAGSVLHAAHTGEIDHLGGLIKRMPRTALAFLVGAAAIAGLPPLNGFVSEYLIFLASFRGATSPATGLAVPLLAGLAGLALISGLAAACFAKAFGIVFLGEPRSEHTARATDPGTPMRWAQFALAGACVAIGLAAPWSFRAVLPAAGIAMGAPAVDVAGSDAPGLAGITATFAAVIALAAALAWLRRRLLAGRGVGETGTWDCGYAAPTARMQYTASSFAQPLTDLFRSVLRTHATVAPPRGLFPEKAACATHTPDVCRESLYRPLFEGIGRSLVGLRRLQHGNLHLYILYIALTLLVLLAWKLR